MALRRVTLWITGRPAAGKTTLARRLVAAIEAEGDRATLIDSDEVRAAITPNATYSEEERAIVYRAIAYVARRASELGVVPVVAATAHHPVLRAAAREIVGEMVLVYARADLSVCEARDPKGIYARARANAHGSVPGVHVPWVEPLDADVVVDTDRAVERDVIASLVGRVRG
jgi:adenylylsulfate kinase